MSDLKMSAQHNKFQGRLEELKRKRFDWSKDELEQFVAWETTMMELMQLEGYLSSEISEKILAKAREILSDFDRKILMGMPADKYQAVLDQREPWLWLLRFYSRDPVSEADILINQVEMELAKPWFDTSPPVDQSQFEERANEQINY